MGRPGRTKGVVVGAGLLSLALAGSACGLHISKNGISGNILGHKFSAAVHQLPAGFPSAVPLPANSRVLGGGGGSDSQGTVYDAAFAVSGSVPAVFSSYQSTFKNAGYTISNVQPPSSVTTPSATASSGSKNTSTTISATGGTFTAKDDSWTVDVLVGSTSAALGDELKPGETGVNVTVAPTSQTTTT